MDGRTQRRLAGAALIVLAAIAAVFIVGTLMANCRGPLRPSPSTAPTSGSPGNSGASPVIPSPDGSLPATPAPGGTLEPSASLPVPTRRLVTPPPGEATPSIEIPPPID